MKLSELKKEMKPYMAGTKAVAKSNWNAFSKTQKAIIIAGSVCEYGMLGHAMHKKTAGSVATYAATLACTCSIYAASGCFKVVRQNQASALEAFMIAAEAAIKEETGVNVVVSYDL